MKLTVKHFHIDQTLLVMQIKGKTLDGFTKIT